MLCTHKTTLLCQFGLFCHQLTTISPSILNHFWWELYHDCSNNQDIWMVLSSITIPPFHDIEILSQLIHIVMSCIALELLPPLHSFIMFATLLFEGFCQIPCYDVEPIQVFAIVKILAHLWYNWLS